MRLGQCRRQLERPLARAFGPLHIVVARAIPFVQRRVHGGQAGPRRTVRRVELDGALEHRRAGLQVGLRQPRKMLAAAQVVLVGTGAGLRPDQRFPFVRAQHVPAQRRRDAGRDLVLDGEHVVQRAVETLRPAVVARGDLDQLDRHAQPIGGLPDAPFEQRLDAELDAHRAHVRARPPELKGRGSRRDPQAVDVGERVDQLLGHAFAEVVLIASRAHVRERKNGDGGDITGRRG